MTRRTLLNLSLGGLLSLAIPSPWAEIAPRRYELVMMGTIRGEWVRRTVPLADFEARLWLAKTGGGRRDHHWREGQIDMIYHVRGVR